MPVFINVFLKLQVYFAFEIRNSTFLLLFVEAQQTNTYSQSTTETLEKGVNLFKVNNKRCHWRRSVVFIANFEHISQLFLVFLLLTLK